MLHLKFQSFSIEHAVHRFLYMYCIAQTTKKTIHLHNIPSFFFLLCSDSGHRFNEPRWRGPGHQQHIPVHLTNQRYTKINKYIYTVVPWCWMPADCLLCVLIMGKTYLPYQFKWLKNWHTHNVQFIIYILPQSFLVSVCEHNIICIYHCTSLIYIPFNLWKCTVLGSFQS